MYPAHCLAESCGKPLRQRLLVIADDEPHIRTMLVRALAGRGYAPLEADNGREALKIVAEYGNRIWAVLSDVNMPEVDGIQLAETLAATHPAIPVALMSGTVDPCAVVHLPNVKHCFVKPFALDVLIARMAELG